MASIVLGAKQIGTAPELGTPFYHTYLVHTDDAGNQQVMHAFTNGVFDLNNLPVALTGDGGGVWGSLVGRAEPYQIINGQPPEDWNDGTHLYTSPLIEGPDGVVDIAVSRMLDRMEEINDAAVPYNPLLQNSNSFTNDLIEAAGLTPELPINAAGEQVWAPAFQNDLPTEPGAGNYWADLTPDEALAVADTVLGGFGLTGLADDGHFDFPKAAELAAPALQDIAFIVGDVVAAEPAIFADVVHDAGSSLLQYVGQLGVADQPASLIADAETAVTDILASLPLDTGQWDFWM